VSYSYASHRAFVFTEAGQVTFLRIRDHAKYLLKTAGACRMQELLSVAGSGSSWDHMACVDRLVELGELQRLTPVGTVSGQHEIFVQGRS
jgi:hypothetical protein